MTVDILCITGGIGGAKLAQGLYGALPPDALTLVVNCGDDFEHLGLEIWPDFDTTLYALAGVADRERGWGRADESWAFLETLKRLGGECWFQLGDRDLATHLLRSNWLGEGAGREAVAKRLTAAFGVRAQLLPATAHSVRTQIETEGQVLAFQDYFVRRRAEPRVVRLHYEGASGAAPGTAAHAALSAPSLRGIVIAPSNPWLSVAPTLAIPEWRAALEGRVVPAVAITPIISGAAVKGPTAKIMGELGLDLSAVSVARFYAGLIDGFVLDERDAHLEDEIRALGMDCIIAQTLMVSDQDKGALARAVLDFVNRLGRSLRTRRSAA